MDSTLLDTLVKLASLGASGICIFAIFWIGWLILHPPQNPDPERHRTLRLFMGTCVIIAVIASASGIANAMINASKIVTLEAKNTTLETNFAKLEKQQLQMQETAKGLEKVLRSKEAIDVNNQSPEIKSHIILLKEFLGEMGIETSG